MTILLSSATWKEGLGIKAWNPVKSVSVEDLHCIVHQSSMKNCLLPEAYSLSSNAKWDKYHCFNTARRNVMDKLESPPTAPVLTSALLCFLLKGAACGDLNALLLFMLHLQMAEGSWSVGYGLRISLWWVISAEKSVSKKDRDFWCQK